MTQFEKVKQYLTENQFVWLITGCAGFIGSNLLETLLALNQKVIGLDNFSTGYQKNLDEALSSVNSEQKQNFRFIEGDITNLDTCHKACTNTDYVLHQAALGSVPRSVEDPINTNQNNISGFLNILVAARDAKVKRFVYAASSSTYGDHPDLPKVEEKTGNPLSPYAVTKLVNELYADVFARVYNFKTIGLRYFNIFGKRQDPNGAYAAVIPKWVAGILKNEKIFINGDGETSRDFCYIDNAIQMNLLAAMVDNPEALNQVYNTALNDRTTLNQLFELIKSNLITLNPDLIINPPIHREFRAGDVRHSQADISKAKKLLLYEPTCKIDQGLTKTMEWYVKNLM